MRGLLAPLLILMTLLLSGCGGGGGGATSYLSKVNGYVPNPNSSTYYSSGYLNFYKSGMYVHSGDWKGFYQRWS